MGNENGLNPTPSEFSGYPNRPVEQVSHDDVQLFLEKLNIQEAGNLPEGWIFDLPTEAQWEYACRAGSKTAYSWGDSISSKNANSNNSQLNQTRVCGQYEPNAWGFYDMHGNVREWCLDWYDYSGNL